MKTFYGMEIPKRNSKCTEGELFLDGEEIYSNLLFENESFIRQDYCKNCWSKLTEQQKNMPSLTQWKSIFLKKEDDKNIFLNREQKILSLFKDKAANDSIESQQEAYILALYLLRKKIIFCRKEFSNENNELFFLLEIAETEEHIIIKKFLNHDLNIQLLQKKIALVLKGH